MSTDPTVTPEQVIKQMLAEWDAKERAAKSAQAEADIVKETIAEMAKQHNMEVSLPGESASKCTRVIEVPQGAYKWEDFAMTFNPSEELIADFSSVNWKGVAESFKQYDPTTWNKLQGKFHVKTGSSWQVRLGK